MRLSQANKILPASLLVYLLGLYFTDNFVLIFIITILLLSADFYYLKNIAGRRLVGLRWWSEVQPIHTAGTASNEQNQAHWVFESADPAAREINKTDKRFFWYALYAVPLLWVGLAIAALVRVKPYWLSLVGESLIYWGKDGELRKVESVLMRVVVIAVSLSVTNTLAFSRCDKFSQASNLASSALYSGGIARTLAGGMISRMFSSR
jgi:hypothetical protein